MQIVQRKSRNYGTRAGWKPDMIVYHITDGGYEGAVETLQGIGTSRKVSSHFVVGRAGQIAQLVDLRNAAYCNGTQSGSPNGVDYVGRAKAALVKSRRTNANYYTVSIECEGTDATHGILTPEQFNAVVWLTKYIRQQVKSIYGVTIPIDRNHLIGHCEIAPREKPDCPGRSFPWNELISALNVLPSRTAIDSPTDGATIDGAFTVGGWGISPNIADHADIYADVGTPMKKKLGTVLLGGRRPDVAKAFPQYQGSGCSGYNLPVPDGVLTPGTHTINVAVIDRKETVCWATRKIMVK